MVLIRVMELVDELRHVLVARGDQHGLAGARGAAGQGADDIVGLHALDAQHRHALRAQDRQQRLDLRAQVIRHRLPVRLVLGEQIVAEGLPGASKTTAMRAA